MRAHSQRRLQSSAVVIELNTLARSRAMREDRPIQCVSSGYLRGGCSCRATVPAAVAEAAWARRLERSAEPHSDFFQFAWQGAVWLGFGLPDGQIRGVYCPTHRAERDARSAGCEVHHLPQRAHMAVQA